MNNLTVVKSNRVIEASYKLSLMEQITLLAGISQIDSRKPLDPTQGFEISVNDLINLCEEETKNEYRDLKIAAERLLTRIVTINNPFPSEKRVTQLKTHWISSVAYVPDEGKIKIYFSPQIVPYLSQLTSEFTKYHLKYAVKMSSIHAIRLYELLMQWKDVGKRDVELAWLKNCFELEDKYPSIKDFKKYVLDIAVKEINTYSDYQVAWTQRKTGRKVTHLIFTFAEKQPTAPKKTKTTAKLKTKAEATKIDNLEHFAKLRKDLGDAANDGVPQDIKEILQAQGRW